MTDEAFRTGSLTERIDAVLAGKCMTYYDLARALFTGDRAWRHSSNGGPPGCFMALSSALRRGNFFVDYQGPGPGNRIVHPRKKP